jgi:ribosome maturation factor RimP
MKKGKGGMDRKRVTKKEYTRMAGRKVGTEIQEESKKRKNI